MAFLLSGKVISIYIPLEKANTRIFFFFFYFQVANYLAAKM